MADVGPAKTFGGHECSPGPERMVDLEEAGNVLLPPKAKKGCRYCGVMMMVMMLVMMLMVVLKVMMVKSW